MRSQRQAHLMQTSRWIRPAAGDASRWSRPAAGVGGSQARCRYCRAEHAQRQAVATLTRGGRWRGRCSRRRPAAGRAVPSVALNTPSGRRWRTACRRVAVGPLGRRAEHAQRQAVEPIEDESRWMQRQAVRSLAVRRAGCAQRQAVWPSSFRSRADHAQRQAVADNFSRSPVALNTPSGRRWDSRAEHVNVPRLRGSVALNTPSGRRFLFTESRWSRPAAGGVHFRSSRAGHAQRQAVRSFEFSARRASALWFYTSR